MGRPRLYDPVCSVPGCAKPHSAKGYCGMHRERVRKYGTPELPEREPQVGTRQNTLDRFWSKVDKDAPGGCWEWTGGLNSSGYGMFPLWPRPAERAHRFSWHMHHGAIPEGLCVLHRCDNRKCLNPSHLFLGTRGDNIRDCFAKGRGNPYPGARAPKPRRSALPT